MTRSTRQSTPRFCLLLSGVAALLATFGSGCDLVKQAADEVAGYKPAAAPAGETPADGETPAANAAPAASGTADGGDLRGDAAGETFVSAANAGPDAPLRSRKTDPYYRLWNPRTSAGPFGAEISVNYERTRRGSGGLALWFRSGDGTSQTVSMWRLNDEIGQINLGSRRPSFAGGGLPKNVEMYLVTVDPRFPNSPKFKVSNSVVLGEMPRTTAAREWTADEAERFRNPPPPAAARTPPSATANLGEDTPFAGTAAGGWTARTVDPDSKPLLGVEYSLGEWAGEKCLRSLKPLFQRPEAAGISLVAKDGYAVGGMNVQSKNDVDAVQLVFMKLGSDGKLDPADRYESDWVGYPTGGASKSLGGDGRRVIGLNCRQGAILDGVALVLDKAK